MFFLHSSYDNDKRARRHGTAAEKSSRRAQAATRCSQASRAAIIEGLRQAAELHGTESMTVTVSG